MDIKSELDTWANYTYEQGIDNLSGYSQNEIAQIKVILDYQGLLNKVMDGKSVANLHGDKTSCTLNGVNMTQIFSDTLNNGTLTPAAYAMNIMLACNAANYDDTHTKKAVGRSLCAFPSFLREFNFAEEIQHVIPGSNCVRTTPAVDKNSHTDILLNYNNREYRIWTYLCEGYTAPVHTADKFLGGRGSLPEGTYILCPIYRYSRDPYMHERYDIYKDWILYNAKYANAVKFVIEKAQRSYYSSIVSKYKKYIDAIDMKDIANKKNTSDVTALSEYFTGMHIIEKT